MSCRPSPSIQVRRGAVGLVSWLGSQDTASGWGDAGARIVVALCRAVPLLQERGYTWQVLYLADAVPKLPHPPPCRNKRGDAAAAVERRGGGGSGGRWRSSRVRRPSAARNRDSHQRRQRGVTAGWRQVAAGPRITHSQVQAVRVAGIACCTCCPCRLGNGWSLALLARCPHLSAKPTQRRVPPALPPTPLARSSERPPLPGAATPSKLRPTGGSLAGAGGSLAGAGGSLKPAAKEQARLGGLGTAAPCTAQTETATHAC